MRMLQAAAVAAATLFASPCPAQVRPAQEPAISVSNISGVLVVANQRYEARFFPDGTLVAWRTLPSGERAEALQAETLRIGDMDFSATQVEVTEHTSFYIRVEVNGTLGDFDVRRIYELTRSSTIYEQLELVPRIGTTPATTVRWTIACDSTSAVTAHPTTADLWIGIALGPLGGSVSGWKGALFQPEVVDLQTAWRRDIQVPEMRTG